MPTKENSAGQQQPYDKENGEYKSFGGSFSSPRSSSSFGANSGYVGYSMSVRAKEAYENDEKPKSQWNKDDIVDAVLSLNENIDEKLLKKLPLDYLRMEFLKRTSWHHTGKFFNRTDFYSIDEDAIEQFTNDKINKELEWRKKERIEKMAMKDKITQKKKEDEILSNYIADVSYTEWIHRHPHEVKLEGVKVQEKGEYADWYVVTDKNGNTFKKKHDSISVYNRKFTPEQIKIAKKRIKQHEEEQKESARDFVIRFTTKWPSDGFVSEKDEKDAMDFINNAYENATSREQKDKSSLARKFGLKEKRWDVLDHEWEDDGRTYFITPNKKIEKGDKRIAETGQSTYKYQIEIFNGKEWEKLNK